MRRCARPDEPKQRLPLMSSLRGGRLSGRPFPGGCAGLQSERGHTNQGPARLP